VSDAADRQRRIDAERRKAATVMTIARARIEEAGLELVRDPYNVYTTDGAAQCTVTVRIPGDLIDATERAAKAGPP
jgi:hypothetical protein